MKREFKQFLNRSFRYLAASTEECMAGKQSSTKKAPAKQGPVTSPIANERGFDLKTWAIALVVVLVTGIVFSGVTKLDWTNWDDDEYVYENEMVLQGDYQAIFTSPVNNNYNPLPVAMHAWEWSQVKDKPSFYHINNLWMHLLCTFLVFWLMKMLGLNPLWAAFAALLFGIHPMRVESVAWVTERKDVMFGLFYVGALMAYVKYLDAKKWVWIGLAAILFTLSLFSKIQAVSLPLSMMAIDWYRGRKWGSKMLMEKVPFFLGSAAIGYVGLRFLNAGNALDVDQTFGLAERVPLGLTAYIVYFAKAIIPFKTCASYPYPKTVPLEYYLGMTAALVVMGGAFVLRKISRETAFGILFFTANIIFLLQIVGAGSAFMADRFSYIAYIGLFFAMAMIAQRLAASRKTLLPVGIGVLSLLLVVCAVLTVQYIPVWKNTDTLFSDVIEKYPRKIVIAYVNRGQYLRRQKQNDRAFADFNTAIELQPKFHLGYLNRGNIYFDRGADDAALADYTKVIELLSPIDTNGKVDIAIPSALSNRGAIYSRKNMIPEALADYKLALKFNPKDKNTWSNRAVTYYNINDFANTINDYTQYLKLDPNASDVYNDRGVCHLRLLHFDDALSDFNKAISLNSKKGTFFLNRAYAYANLKNVAAAKVDLAKAQAMGVVADPAFEASLQ